MVAYPDSDRKPAPTSGNSSHLPVVRPSPPRRLVLKSVLAAAVTLITAEGALRAYIAWRGWTPNCYAAQLQLFRPNTETGYDLQPGFRLRSGVYQMSINSLGLRGPDVSRRKPAGVKRIAIVGESSAFGYFVTDGAEAARLLEKTLRERGENVDVLNGGVPGYNLFQSIAHFREVLAPLEPDIVIAYLGWNDLPYVVSDDPAAERFRRRPMVSARERLLSHSTLYGFLVYRLWGGQVRMVPADFANANPTIGGERQFLDNLAVLASEVEAVGARLIVCAQATAAQSSVAADLRPALGPSEVEQARCIRLGEWLHRTLADFAAERDLPFIDAYREITPTKVMLADYVHLTSEGERRLAELWAEELEKPLAPNGAARR
jgi:lysophospholipase L1-like esterase